MIIYKVCALIVTYNPNADTLLKLVKLISNQVNTVLIIDNNSTASVDYINEPNNVYGCTVTINKFGDNYGVGYAQNRGIEWARENGFTHVLLMDQDSIPHDDMLNRLSSALADLHSQGIRVSAVGPRYVDPITGFESPFVRFGIVKYKLLYPPFDRHVKSVPVELLISSGLLLSLDTLDTIGLMDEGFFIDLVDTEWLLRAQALGFTAFGVPDAVMSHSLGDKSLRVWLGRWCFVPIHTPLRHYYAFRNSILLSKRSYASLQWIVINSVQLAYMLCFFSLFISPRLRHMSMMFKGLWDGFRGRTGRLE